MPSNAFAGWINFVSIFMERIENAAKINRHIVPRRHLIGITIQVGREIAIRPRHRQRDGEGSSKRTMALEHIQEDLTLDHLRRNMRCQCP